MPDLIEFRVTFGSKHAGQPSFPAAHPDGWITILAPDETAARNVVHARIGSAWSFIYQLGCGQRCCEADWGLYPLGELARWTTTEPTQVGS